MLAVTLAGEAVYEGEAGSYDIPEDAMIARTILYYNDPEPCEIRRGAVRSRVLMELESVVPFDASAAELPGDMQQYFPEGARVRVYAEES